MYKVWFLLIKRWLGFEDVYIMFEIDSIGWMGCFVFCIFIDGFILLGLLLIMLWGCWLVECGLVLIVIVL